MLTLELMRRLWPHGNTRVPGLLEGIVAAAPTVFPKYGLNSPLVIAHAMAQFSHECGAGDEMVENLNYSANGLRKTWPSRFHGSDAEPYARNPKKIADKVYNGRMGDREGTDDGWNYRGRGLSQCTGREGYEKLSKKTGLDLINNPDLLLDPAHALECGVADFVLCGCLPYAEKDDVLNVTKHLNGGEIGLAQREEWLAKWKRALIPEHATAFVTLPQPTILVTTKPTPVVVPKTTSNTPKAPIFMSKLSELAGSVTDALKSVEADAERALSRLHTARDNAGKAVGKIDGISSSIEKSTADIENFTNQITNGGPPLE